MRPWNIFEATRAKQRVPVFPLRVRTPASRCRRASLLHLLSPLLAFFASVPTFPAWAQPGDLDTTFDPGTGVDSLVYSIAVQTNGQILIGGDFTSFDGTSRTNIARLNANGHLDAGFDPGSAIGGSFSYVDAVALQPGGEVLLGGSFTSQVATNLARLKTNGTLDTNFGVQTDDTVNAIVVQTNGAAVLAGFFTEVNGVARSRIARMDTNGVVDADFTPNVAGNPFASIFALALQNDGKIILGGSFISIDSTPSTNIARLTASGSPDPDFKPGSVAGGQLSSAVYAVAVDGEGGILAGGDFSSVDGTARTNLVRLNSDGTLDRNFDPGLGTDSAVNVIVPQSDGKLLIGGYFTSVDGTPRNHIARLNPDGRPDNSFDPKSGADGVIYSVALQPDGMVLIGGGFASFDDTPRGGIARLQNVISLPAPQLVNPIVSNSVFTVSVATVSGKNYLLQFKDALTDAAWTPLPAIAGDGTIKALVDPAATGRQRLYRVQVE